MELEKVYAIAWNLNQIRNNARNRVISRDYLVKFNPDKIIEQLGNFKFGLKALIRNLEEVSISSQTLIELNNLVEQFNVFISEIRKIRENKEEERDTWDLEDGLREIFNLIIDRMPIWQDRIQLELRNVKIKKLYTETLINPNMIQKGASSFFSQKIWKKMKDIEKQDLEDGCACILVEAWTPAAMILIRSIESGFRTYYSNITTNDPTGKNWGIIL